MAIIRVNKLIPLLYCFHAPGQHSIQAVIVLPPHDFLGTKCMVRGNLGPHTSGFDLDDSRSSDDPGLVACKIPFIHSSDLLHVTYLEGRLVMVCRNGLVSHPYPCKTFVFVWHFRPSHFIFNDSEIYI
jgi:hypothetical protein